jgi:hypothetical protein
MLTHNDVTVEDAIVLFEECADLPCKFWGMKDIGLARPQMEALVNRMKERGKSTFLEIVSLTEEECMAGARLAVNCRFDYLMGTIYYPVVHAYLKKEQIKYFPFCGRVTGHPSMVEGTIQDAIDDGKKLETLGVDGFDLLAYRFTGDPEHLAEAFIRNTTLPVVLAGSISSFERLDRIKALRPWGFTIGTAFFEKRFSPDGTFAQQIERVISYMAE